MRLATLFFFIYLFFFTIKSWTTETMFYFLNKIARCFTLQSSCLGELIKPLKIEPSSVQVPIKLCGIKLRLVSSKQFFLLPKYAADTSFSRNLTWIFFCHVIRIRDIKFTPVVWQQGTFSWTDNKILDMFTAYINPETTFLQNPQHNSTTEYY